MFLNFLRCFNILKYFKTLYAKFFQIILNYIHSHVFIFSLQNPRWVQGTNEETTKSMKNLVDPAPLSSALHGFLESPAFQAMAVKSRRDRKKMAVSDTQRPYMGVEKNFIYESEAPPLPEMGHDCVEMLVRMGMNADMHQLVLAIDTDGMDCNRHDVLSCYVARVVHNFVENVGSIEDAWGKSAE